MKLFPGAVLGFAAMTATAAACSSTVTGTGIPGTSSGTTASSTSSGSTGSVTSSSGTSGEPACASIGGTWIIDGCDGESCDVTQTGCNVTLRCNAGLVLYSGSITGNALTYKGLSYDGISVTCSAVIDAETSGANGSCSADESGESCLFSASKF